MRKFLTAFLLSWGCMALLPPKGHAVPLDVPYAISVSSTIGTGSIILSTANFPSANTSVNANLVTGNYQWCVSHVVVSGNVLPTNFTMAWSTGPFNTTISPGTTDYKVTVSTLPYDVTWPYRQPYCAPAGQPVLTLTSSVAATILQVEAYLWKGWNP